MSLSHVQALASSKTCDGDAARRCKLRYDRDGTAPPVISVEADFTIDPTTSISWCIILVRYSIFSSTCIALAVRH